MIRVLRVARRGALKARVAAAEQLYGVRSSAPRSCASRCSGSRSRPWFGRARPCDQDPSPARPLPPRPACGPWLGAGNNSRLSSTSSTPNSKNWSPRSLLPWSPCPGSGSTPPGSCWSPPATIPSGCAQRPPSRTGAAPPRSRRPQAAPTTTGRNRGGDRHANNTLWPIALVRMRCHPPTRAYVERRTNQGLSKPDIMRCLKRSIAREVYHHLTTHQPSHLPLA
jgi:hypothetical protein